MLISPIQRIDYDPSNKSHRDAYFHFLKTGKWIKHFNIKFPFEELPHQLAISTLMYFDDKENRAVSA